MPCPACLIALMGTDQATAKPVWYEHVLMCAAPDKQCIRVKHALIAAGVIAALVVLGRD